jgi:hypothetical protein
MLPRCPLCQPVHQSGHGSRHQALQVRGRCWSRAQQRQLPDVLELEKPGAPSTSRWWFWTPDQLHWCVDSGERLRKSQPEVAAGLGPVPAGPLVLHEAEAAGVVMVRWQVAARRSQWLML